MVLLLEDVGIVITASVRWPQCIRVAQIENHGRWQAHMDVQCTAAS